MWSLKGKMRASGVRFSPTGAFRTTGFDGSIFSPTSDAERVPSNQR